MNLIRWFRALFAPSSKRDVTPAPSFVVRRTLTASAGKPGGPPGTSNSVPLSLEDQVRLRVRDAFMPSQPVSSQKMFAGRLSLLDGVIEAVEDQRAHVILFGERGIGKTSLLRVLTEVAREAGYVVTVQTCGGGSTFENIFRDAARQIPLLFYGGMTPMEIQTRDSSLADVIQEGSGPSEITRVLSAVAGARVVIILDEFDRVEDEAFPREVAELIKNLSDASARVQLVIAGVAHNLQQLIGHSPSIRRNIIGVPVAPMSDEEVAKLIEIGESYSGLPFSPAAKEKVINLAHGRPYIARLLAQHAGLNATEKVHNRVEVADVNVGLRKAVNEMESRLSVKTRGGARVWLRDRRDEVLAIAQAGLASNADFTIDDVAGALPAKNSVTDVLTELVQAGDLNKAEYGGSEIRYRFAEEALPSYIVLAARVDEIGDQDLPPEHPIIRRMKHV